VYLRKALFQARHQIEEVLKRKVGMQAANNVKLGDRLAVSGGRGFKSFFEGHGIGARRVLFSAEGAQAAGRHAYIRGINVAVYIEISPVAMEAFTNVVRHPTHGQNIAGLIKRKRVIAAQTLPGNDPVFDGNKPPVIGMEWMQSCHSY